MPSQEENLDKLPAWTQSTTRHNPAFAAKPADGSALVPLTIFAGVFTIFGGVISFVLCAMGNQVFYGFASLISALVASLVFFTLSGIIRRLDTLIKK